jgi:DNA polymerase-1
LVLGGLEQAGIRVTAACLWRPSHEQERSSRIFALAGESFNINSPKQLGEILFAKLKLPVLKKTGTTRAASTSVDVLEELALAHELPHDPFAAGS